MRFWNILSKSDTTVTDLGNDTYIVKGAEKGGEGFALLGKILLPLVVGCFIYGFFTSLVVEPIQERTTEWTAGNKQFLWCGDQNRDEYYVEASTVGDKLSIRTHVRGTTASKMLIGDTNRRYAVEAADHSYMIDSEQGAIFHYDNSTRTLTATGLTQDLMFPQGTHTWTNCKVRD